jgi:sensor histidine kinase YesM
MDVLLSGINRIISDGGVGSVIYSLLSWVVTVVSVLFVFLFCRSQYEARFKSRYINVTGFLLSAQVHYEVGDLGVPLVNILFTVAFVNFIGLVFFKGKLVNILLKNQVFVILLFFCNFCTAIILSLISRTDVKTAAADVPSNVIANLVNTFLIYLSYRILLIVFDKKSAGYIKYREILTVTVLFGFEIFNMYSFVIRAETTADTIVFGIMIAGFFLTDTLVLYEMATIGDQYRLQYELKMITEQNALQTEHLRELSEKFNESRRVIHDARRHIMAIESLHGSSGLSHKYAEIMIEQLDTFLNNFTCRSEILTVITNQKLIAAKNAGIDVNFNIEDLPFTRLRDADITALFANLWDNAIEACKEIPERDRRIDMTIGKDGEYLLVRFENTYSGHLNRKNGRIYSKKRDGHEGYGLSIITSTAESYGGFVNITADEKTFCISIVFPY